MRIYMIITALLFTVFDQPPTAAFDNGRAGFSLVVNNEIYPYREFSTYLLPKERLVVRINDQSEDEFVMRSDSGSLETIDGQRWLWTAPADSGLNTIRVERVKDGETITLRAFVMVSSGKMTNRRLNGVLIGRYPAPIASDPLYAAPEGFIEVTSDNLNTRVSPHFVLGQFVSPLDNRFPKYIVLRERLLLKLEAILERLNQHGYEADSLGIVAGYMTPAYNASTGRDQYSRHIYGGAALFNVDQDPADGTMDDLNGDGEIDDRDARILFTLVDDLFQEEDKSFLRGGLFLYRKTDKGGPFILVDARGYRKRWIHEIDLFPDMGRVQEKMQELKTKQPGQFR